MERGLDVVFLGLASFLFGVYFLRLGSSYVAKFGAMFDGVAVAYATGFAAVACVLVTRAPRLSDARLSLLLTFAWIPIYWLRSVQGLGDDWLRHMRRHDGVMLSEALSEALLRIIYEAGGWSLTPFLSPVCAVPVTFLSILTLLELVPEGPHARRWRVFAVLLFASSGLHLLFFRGFVETTQIAAPFAVAAVFLLLRFAKSGDRRQANGAGLMAGIACLCHGSHAFWLPVLALAPVLTAGEAWRRPRRRDFVPLGLALGVIGVTLTVLHETEWFRVFVGNAAGGGDFRAFVPLLERTSPYERYLFFSLAHFADAANVFATSGFALLLLIPALAWRRVKPVGSVRQPEQGPYVVLVLLFLAHAALYLSWNFDYGYPRDYDLMTSLGLTWLGLPLVVAMRLWSRPPVHAWAVLALAACASWRLISGLLAPPS